MKLRVVWRAAQLGITLAKCALDIALRRLRGPLTLEQRALWMHKSCRAVLTSLHVDSQVHGRPPAAGLLVANHLSYLDIGALGAALPCFFVSKEEVRNWPYFGTLARANGTLFLTRSSRSSTNRVAKLIAERLAFPAPIILFPEGTSTDGSALLRFHPFLYEPAIQGNASITAAALRYLPAEGAHERDFCWFGDDAFLPHFFKVLGVNGFSAEVRFGTPKVYADRREAAIGTYKEIAAMRAAGASFHAPPEHSASRSDCGIDRAQDCALTACEFEAQEGQPELLELR